jgi:tetratricopeptide (TPR) repeat protein
MVHMPSHIYIRTGDHDRSAAVNVTAADVDRKYIERSGATGVYPLMYYSHNLHFVSYARMMQGNYTGARDYAVRLRKNVAGAIDGMPMLAPYGAFEWVVLTRFGKWKEMLAEPQPSEKTLSMQAFYRYARGLAYAGLGQVPDARAEYERLVAICDRIPAEDRFMINPVRDVMAIASAELSAKIARAQSDADREIAELRRAVELQDKLGYMEPPEWHYPVREALGGALLRRGLHADAEAVFRKDLDINPRNARSLYGLLQSLKAQSRTVDAAWIEKQFADSWRHASITLDPAQL